MSFRVEVGGRGKGIHFSQLLALVFKPDFNKIPNYIFKHFPKTTLNLILS